jgi:hypothetical protein
MSKLRNSDGLFSVNWEDGMLIGASHFIDQEAYFENLNRWGLEHGTHLFGLAGPTPGLSSTLEIKLEHDGQNWVVVLSRCYALTASGKIINIDSRADNSIKTAPITAWAQETAPVYVQALPTKHGVGQPTGQSEPSRFPYRATDYKLTIGNLRDADPADCLKLAEIKLSDGRPVMSSEYIPPSMVLGSYPLLAENCHRLAGLLILAQQTSVMGFQAFCAAEQDVPGKYGIEHKWFREMLSSLAIQLGGMKGAHPSPLIPMAPYRLIDFYRQVFGFYEAMLDTYRESTLMLKKKFGDNEIFVRFTSGIKEIGEYNHYELGPQVSKLLRMMNDFIEVLHLISSLAGAMPQAGLIMNYRNREYRLQRVGAIHSQVERDSVTVKIEGLPSLVSRDVLVGLSRELFSGVDYRYIMVKIGLNENSVPGRMDPVYVDSDASSGNLLLKPMDDLACQAINSINLNFRGNFNPQELSKISVEMINVYTY